MVLSKIYIKKKIFTFSRRRKDCSVMKTHFHKFLNFLMRKGYKNKYISFFYKLMRVYKKRVSTIYRWRRDTLQKPIPSKENLLTFSKFIQLVFDKITLELELKYRKFRKKEILTPIPISPWRGIRLGLNMLLKNTKSRIDKKKRTRKNKFLYNVLDELWDTQNNISLTCKQVVEFTTNVLENSENYR